MPIIHFTSILSWLSAYLKIFSKPIGFHSTLGSFADLSRSRTHLIAENALLRHQLIILRRQAIRPRITRLDRLRLLFFSRFTPVLATSMRKSKKSRGDVATNQETERKQFRPYFHSHS